MEIFNESIKGFASLDQLIQINDVNGRPFYFFPNTSRQRITFNLPSGIYFTDNNIEELEQPLEYILPELPKKEKSGEFPENFDIEIMENPNKCSVDIESGLIIFDTELFKKWEKPKINFVLFHELGHCYYKTEWKCDLIAASKMLEMGFNPSQCLYSSYHCLSEKNIERKNILNDYLKKVKVK